jgi:CheY-like chemotaxis protein
VIPRIGRASVSVLARLRAPPGKHTTYAWDLMPLNPDIGSRDYETFKQEFAERIIEKWARYSAAAIPVIAVTAFAMKGDEERIREGGCEAYLSKPISVAKFIETIRRFLGIGLTIPAVSRGKQFATSNQRLSAVTRISEVRWA